MASSTKRFSSKLSAAAAEFSPETKVEMKLEIPEDRICTTLVDLCGEVLPACGVSSESIKKFREFLTAMPKKDVAMHPKGFLVTDVFQPNLLRRKDLDLLFIPADEKAEHLLLRLVRENPHCSSRRTNSFYTTVEYKLSDTFSGDITIAHKGYESAEPFHWFRCSKLFYFNDNLQIVFNEKDLSYIEEIQKQIVPNKKGFRVPTSRIFEVDWAMIEENPNVEMVMSRLMKYVEQLKSFSCNNKGESKIKNETLRDESFWKNYLKKKDLFSICKEIVALRQLESYRADGGALKGIVNGMFRAIHARLYDIALSDSLHVTSHSSTLVLLHAELKKTSSESVENTAKRICEFFKTIDPKAESRLRTSMKKTAHIEVFKTSVIDAKHATLFSSSTEVSEAKEVLTMLKSQSGGVSPS